MVTTALASTTGVGRDGQPKPNTSLNMSMCGANKNMVMNKNNLQVKRLLEEIKDNEDSYIGKIVTLKYNVRIEDEHGNHSLFLPRLVEIRNDKTVADTEKQIE